MMNNLPTQIIEQAKQVNVLDLVGKYTELQPESRSKNEYHGSCLFCGGSKRFVVKPDGWFCRDCTPIDEMHGWHSAIDFIKLKMGLNYRESVIYLAGPAFAGDILIQKTQSFMKQPSQSAQSPEWHTKALAMVTAAQERAEAYLGSRKIDLSTALAFGLGYRPDVLLPGTWESKKRTWIHLGQPALVIPWYRAERLVAVRYRFLSAQPYTDTKGKSRCEKVTAIPDSDFTGLLCASHMLPEFCTMPVDENGKCAEQYRTLVIIEGEINAMSVWQVMNGCKWDVLSIGSESQPLPAGGRKLAERYGRTIVWMDKAEVAKKIMSQIAGAVAVNSPIIEGKARDANDMLQAGQLVEFLQEVRWRACKSDEERERVNWDWWEALVQWPPS